MSKTFKFIKSENDYQNAMQVITDYINNLRAENQMLKDMLNSYNKDEEIAKLKTEMDELWSNSLIVLYPKEKDRIKTFKQKHYEKCKNGNEYTYHMTGTGIGTVIEIECPVCKGIQDVTDVDSW